MAIKMPRNLGMLCLAVWLILTGAAGVTTFALPPLILPVLALVAGVLIVIGR